MSESDRVPDDVKSFLRSVLISSNGVKESRVQKDYHELSGERLMWKNYGFSSLNQFLNALPDVCVLQYNAKDRENRVYGVRLEGTYMSTHAKKNVKTANAAISCAKETNAPLVNGRLVQQDGNSFKVTLTNDQGDKDPDNLIPNKSGLYQVYVAKLPSSCTESDLKECFEVYGNVVEQQIVLSSIKKKIGFVRYTYKNEALRALSEGKKNPPKIHGVEVEVGKPKKYSNNSNTSMSSTRSSEPSEGSLSSTPSSPIKHSVPSTVIQQLPLKNSVVKPLMEQDLALKSPSNTQIPFFGQAQLSPLGSTVEPSTLSNLQRLSTSNQSMQPMTNQSSSSQRPLTLNKPEHPIVSNSQRPSLLKPPMVNQPFNPRTPLSVQVPVVPTIQQHIPLMQASNTRGPWTLDQKSPTKTLLSIQPVHQRTSGVIITGYDNKVSKVNLKKEFEAVGNLEQFEYQPHYSIAYFNNENTVANVVNDLNGKLLFGCVLLVKPFTECPPVLDEAKPTNIPLEEKLPELQHEFSKIYKYHSKAMSLCCGQQYLHWLNNLPAYFEVKIMDLIDPCTFWIHLSDGTKTHLEFNDLCARLSYINPSSGLRHLNKNEFGAGIFSDDDLWYRCYCLEASTDGLNLLVLYIDYGNTEWLKREKTVKLSNVFFDLRPQGVLVQLSGMRFKSNNDQSLVDSVLSSAKKLLIFEVFTAQKASVDSDKPFLLKIVLVHSKGESVMDKLASLPGVETRRRESSPGPPLLLSAPPAAPSILQPLKARLSDVNSACVLIWITNIMSPTTFHFHIKNDQSAEAIEKIRDMLLKCNTHNKVNVKDLKEIGIVCYHKNGLERSRVVLINSAPAGTPGKVTVLHVDTGKEAVVPLTSFIALPIEARNIAYQARPAQLFGVPHDTLARSSEALEFMILQASQVLRGIVVKENADESVLIELFNSEGTSVNKKLLEMARPFQHQAVPSALKTSSQNQAVPSALKTSSQNQAVPSALTTSSQNQPVPSALMTSSQNRVSPSSFGQASPIQTPVQVSPNQAFPKNQVSTNQAPTQNQALHSQPLTTTQAPPRQNFSMASPNQAFGQKQIPVHYPFEQNQAQPAKAFPLNQPSPQAQPSLRNQAFPQGNAPPNQSFGQKQGSPQSQVSTNQNTVQASQNRPFNHNRAAPNQAHTQASPQNQASPNQPLATKQASLSPNWNIDQSQAPQNRAQPNQAIAQTEPAPQNRASPNQASALKQASPKGHVSPNQNTSSQVPQNRVSLQNQPHHITTQSAPNQTHNQEPSNQQQKRSQSNNQVFFQCRVSPNQASPNLPATTHHQTTGHSEFHQNATQSRATPTTSQPASTRNFNGPTNNLPNTADKTKFSETRSVRDLKSSGSTSQAVASHGISSQTVSSPVTSQGTTSQSFASRSVTSQGTTSQGITSQSSTSHSSTSQSIKSQGTTSQTVTSQGTTSQGITSLNTTSETVTSQGATSSPTKVGKTRSNSSVSAGSKNSSNSDENWNEPTTENDHEVQSVLPAKTAGPDKKTSPAMDKTRPQALNKFHTTKQLPAGQKPLRNAMTASGSKSKNSGKTNTGFTDKNPKQFNLHGAGKMAPTAESNTRNFTAKGGKKFNLTNSGKLKDLTEKVAEQKKVFAGPRAELQQRVEMYKSREKLELVYRIKVLENENLVLESEIKKNLEEKAELEKQL